jgi:hypothetical protein
MHRHCHHDSLLWLVLLAIILNDGDKQPSQPSNEHGAGCAGCANALLLLVVLLIGVLVVLGNTRPDPSVPSTVTLPVYVEPEPTPDVAPRAILVEMSAPRAELIALPVRRATLVKLAKAGQVTASVRVH